MFNHLCVKIVITVLAGLMWTSTAITRQFYVVHSFLDLSICLITVCYGQIVYLAIWFYNKNFCSWLVHVTDYDSAKNRYLACYPVHVAYVCQRMCMITIPWNFNFKRLEHLIQWILYLHVVTTVHIKSFRMQVEKLKTLSTPT